MAVVLDAFSGPLDLLLHLIQKQEINIHDIPIASITEQYMAYLQAMEELSLEVASEFLVMAATLLAIKSRMLLPRPTRAPDPQAEAAELDPRAELVEQLLEYQRCKWAAEQLKERSLQQSQVYSRPPLDLSAFAPATPPPVRGVSLWDLVDAYRRLLQRIPPEERIATLNPPSVTVEEQLHFLVKRLRRAGQASFTELVGLGRTRSHWVAAFLALLELVKQGMVTCQQVLPLGDIVVLWKGGEQG
ncbi:MAG: segregation/condensation protein A [Alicyclobacillus sp.]|nr:segregation/condensation protein A [Alicyclobacillus sp.]